MRNFRRIAGIAALVLLCAVTALFVLSCGKEKEEAGTGTDNAGEITITVEVINSAGEHTDHTITTKASKLADALLEAGFVEGPIEEYGLYITTVDGETADWNVDQSYWALSQNGEYLMTGASETDIHDGDHFELTYTKG